MLDIRRLPLSSTETLDNKVTWWKPYNSFIHIKMVIILDWRSMNFSLDTEIN